MSTEKKAHELCDYGRRCAWQIFQPATVMRFHSLFGWADLTDHPDDEAYKIILQKNYPLAISSHWLHNAASQSKWLLNGSALVIIIIIITLMLCWYTCQRLWPRCRRPTPWCSRLLRGEHSVDNSKRNGLLLWTQKQYQTKAPPIAVIDRPIR